MKKKILSICLASALGMVVSSGLHAETSTTAAATTQQQTAPLYLGVVVGPVPQAVQAQLPEDITHNQGLMVRRVMPNSPAESAGIKVHDVLLTYNSKALISPQDLIQAVRNGTADQPVGIQILRHGKVEDVSVTLAEMKHHPHSSPAHPMMGQPRPWSNGEMVVEKSYQSIQVKKLPDGKVNAAIEFMDANGDMKKYEYNGSSDDVRKQIEGEKNLPDMQKQQLLNAIGGNSFNSPMRGFSGFPNIQEFEREFFSPPPWARPYRPNFWD